MLFNEGEVSMNDNKCKIVKQEVKSADFDNTNLIDGIYKLKSYINIINGFVENHVENQDYIDLGLMLDNMSEIIDNLAKEYGAV